MDIDDLPQDLAELLKSAGIAVLRKKTVKLVCEDCSKDRYTSLDAIRRSLKKSGSYISRCKSCALKLRKYDVSSISSSLPADVSTISHDTVLPCNKCGEPSDINPTILKRWKRRGRPLLEVLCPLCANKQNLSDVSHIIPGYINLGVLQTSDMFAITCHCGVAGTTSVSRLRRTLKRSGPESPYLCWKCSLSTDSRKKKISFHQNKPGGRDALVKAIQALGAGERQSNPEKAVASFLQAHEFNYVYNKALGPYNFDFYIETKNVYIEVQGEYWHSKEAAVRRDAAKYTYLRSCEPEARLLYIWDYDLNTGAAEQKLRSILLDGETKAVDFGFDDVTVAIPETTESVRRFLNSWHYAQYGKRHKFIVCAYYKDLLIAAAKFGPVSRKEIATSIGETPKTAFELDRLCVHPSYHKKNFTSWFLSRACKLFFKEFPSANCLVSFSDDTYGHSGIVYKACNWEKVGRVKPNYVYVDSVGWITHKKTIYNRAQQLHVSVPEYVSKHNLLKVYGKSKTKFLLRRK